MLTKGEGLRVLRNTYYYQQSGTTFARCENIPLVELAQAGTLLGPYLFAGYCESIEIAARSELGIVPYSKLKGIQNTAVNESTGCKSS